MLADIDHIVLWVEDPIKSVDFYEGVVGLAAVRREEYIAGRAPFTSARVSTSALIDLMPHSAAASVSSGTKAENTAGYTVNHVCLSMSQQDYDALEQRLNAAGVDTSSRMEQTFGARGIAPHAFYFRDPDNNVVEARYYTVS